MHVLWENNWKEHSILLLIHLNFLDSWNNLVITNFNILLFLDFCIKHTRFFSIFKEHIPDFGIFNISSDFASILKMTLI